MPRLIHHIAIGVRDVEGVARFYREAFGLPEVARHFTQTGALRSIWLDSGQTIVMVERTEEPAREVAGVGVGPFLLAFSVEASEREALEGALERAGSVIEERTEHSSYARDPEGNRVAISHYPRP